MKSWTFSVPSCRKNENKYGEKKDKAIVQAAAGRK